MDARLLRLLPGRGSDSNADTRTGDYRTARTPRTLPALEVLDEQGGLGVMRRARQFGGVLTAGAVLPTSGNCDGTPVVGNRIRCLVSADELMREGWNVGGAADR